MIKRLLAVVTLLCAFPVLVNAAASQKQITPKKAQADQADIVSSARLKFTLTATAGAGGLVNPAKRVAFAGEQRPPKTFIFKPRFNTGVEAITGTYLTNTTFLYKNAVTGAEIPSLPAQPGVKVKVVITDVTDNATLAGVFATLQTVAGPNQTVLTGSLVTLNGSLSTGFGPYAWTQESGPTTVSLSNADTNTATFTAPAVGTYVFRLTHGETSATTAVFVTDSLTQVIRVQCNDCHAGLGIGTGVYANWSSSVHKNNFVVCYDCHVGANTGTHPGFEQCATCHVSGVVPTDYNSSCAACHSGTDVHGAQLVTRTSCIDCHAVAIKHPGLFVNDNNGVRAIVPEFGKRSHHITGGSPTDAQCVVCHLEGTVVAGQVVINRGYHMVDNKIYLRNADTGNTAYVWDGADHTAMDNFCFSCHDSNGFNGIAASGLLAATGFTGTASNPFGDTLTNGYDQVARPGVVDVRTAFTTTNASHHAVSGQRYKYRFSTVANATAWATRNGKPVPAASEIAVGNLDLNGNPIQFVEGEDSYDPFGPEKGGHATLYEGDKFVATYIPLGATQNVADNSTLHCGDCHTVGQWTPASSTNADGSVTPVAIGAHGSANEYLLRNSLGTDAIHNQLTYVCFNCHAASTQAATAAAWAEQVAESLIADSVAPVSGSPLNPKGLYIPAPVPTWKAGWNALHPTVFPGQMTGYWTAHAVSAMHIQCQADSADNITSVPDRGFANFSSVRLQRSWAPQAVKIYDFVPAPGATAIAPLGGSNAASGNITGIACTNCHNSALRSAFGGIHGGDNTYTDGLGRTQKSYRFMPGMGNYRYAPPGGWDGEDVSDPTLLTINNPLYPGTPGNRNDQSVGYPGPSGKPMGGCYTNGGSTSAGDLNNSGGVTYGVCNHHGTSTAASAAPGPGRPATFRATYGGGTTGNPTTFEPTVREATAGGTLVTRPLQY